MIWGVIMEIIDLRDLLENEIVDLYSAEEQIVKQLPLMAAKVSDSFLKQALLEHLTQTEEHIVRLKNIMNHWGLTKSNECEGMKGILDEATILINKLVTPVATNAGIILAAQKVEHYEIAVYGGVVDFAKHLELNEIAELLEMTLEEEKEADKKLTKIAQGGIFNPGVNEKAIDDM